MRIYEPAPQPADPEFRDKAYEQHKEKIRSYQKTHRESHKDERATYMQSYRETHKEDDQTYNKKKWEQHKLVNEYLKQHPEITLETLKQ